MNGSRYTLEPYKGMKTRYHCPQCNHRGKTFARYIDTETGEHIAPEVGRCNRESKCGYHYKPSEYFKDNGKPFEPMKLRVQPVIRKPEPPTSYIPAEMLKASLKGYEQNNFVRYLIERIGETDTRKAIERYLIGTSKQFDGGSVVFWQIDALGRIRTGKIMQYEPTTGKRIKEPKEQVNWVHSLLHVKNYQQCFFGEHLLKDKRKPVAIVESEKTAIIASTYFPDFIWLAAGNKQGLTEQKCRALAGRAVTLFPDLKAFDQWKEKAERLSSIAKFQVSDYLERSATPEEKEQGLDIADFLYVPF